MLIGSIRLQDTAGKLVMIQLSWIQLLAGISTPLLEYRNCIQYIPGGWIPNLQQHSVYHNKQVKIHNRWIPKTQRLNDRIKMDFVTHTFPDWMWCHINRCRLYLHTNTITDITFTDRTFITSHIRTVSNRIRDNKILFPAQGKPLKQTKDIGNTLSHQSLTKGSYICH